MFTPNVLDYLHTVPIQQRGLAIYKTSCGKLMKPRTEEEQAGKALCPWCTTHQLFGTETPSP